ncbi:MAG: hypothetical protein O3B01_20295 [Planctomycetota bacterium]|nr:hypothetical protein [Planctomycetota bacterium]MDA1140912.1 hypothetical protein [Planctomycetota bacterium]
MNPIPALIQKPVPNSADNLRYQQILDDAVAETLADYDCELGLLPLAEAADKNFKNAHEEWSSDERHRVCAQPGFHAYYNQGRGSAAMLGRFAFCLTQQSSRFFQSTELLDVLRAGLRSYQEKQLPSGEFAFCPVRYSTIYGTHEMAWRLEPLLCAFLWAGELLGADEHATIEAMLRAAAEFLLGNVCTDANNRGAVWSAITSLCGHWLGDERYLQAAAYNWEPCRREMMTPSGQVAEQGGPDGNYSYTGFSYVYLYRIYSGDASLDECMVKALRWFLLTHTRSGFPFEGTSTRKRIVLNRTRMDIVPALLMYADREPWFKVMADQILDKEQARGSAAGGHMISPLIWMMLGASEVPEGDVEEPAWHREGSLDCRMDVTRYILYRRSYQTSLNLRSLQPMKGIQTWALGDEPPIIHPGKAVCSRTMAWGIDTAAMNVSSRPMAANFYDFAGGRDPISWTYLRQESLWTGFIFTNDATLVIYDGEATPRISQWAVNLAAVSEPRINEGVVAFNNLRGRLSFLCKSPVLKESGEEGVLFLEFETQDAEITIFAFGSPEFQFLESSLEGRRLNFTDGSKSYEVEILPRPVHNPERSAPPDGGFVIRQKT